MEIGGNMNMDVDMNMLGHDHHHHHHQHHNHHNININSSNIGSRGQNGNNTTHLASWDIWHTTTAASNNTTTATTDNSGNLFYSAAAVTVAANGSEGDASSHPLLLGHPLQQQQQQQEQQQLSNNFYSGGAGSHYQPDPHLMCLKLGKRHYFEDHAHVPPALLDERHVGGFPVGMMMTKRGKAAAAAAAAQLYGAGGVGGPRLALKVVPRCQVEGCHVALVNAKEYHRRHKVCETHSKASKVTVLGQDQRFCQQCSRFHVVSEFDESKRSCRRRLAGHNERRRKSSHDSQEHKVMVGGKFRYLSSSTGRALSLLSSKTSYDSWVSPSDLSSRSSAALRELIAENRAAILARQLLISSPSTSNRNCWVDSSSVSHNNDVHAITEDLFGDHGQSWSNSVDESNHHHHQMFSDQNHDHHGWDRFHETRGANLTLDLRQTPSQVYGFLPQRAKTKAEEDQECDMWNSFQED